MVSICLIFLFFEISSWPFLAEYSSRPNQLFFQYFTHPKEVLLTIWADHKLLMFGALLFLGYFGLHLWRKLSLQNDCQHAWPYWKQVLILPLVLALLTLGARSGIGQANANPGLAAFSNQHLSNQIALNATYSLAYAIYTAIKAPMDAEALFGAMEDEEVFRRIKKYMDVREEDFTSTNIPTLHKQKPLIEREHPINLIIIVMEGLGSDYVGAQGGHAVTPNFDKLSKEGVLFTNVFSIGTRTSRGMEALVSGYLPTPKSSSIMKMDVAQHKFFTVASLLKDFNYSTSFIYGGEAHFDNMASFFRGNGFDSIIDERDFQDPVFYGTWGVSDEDIFNKANQIYSSHPTNKPFLSVILTISNHTPFDFPENRISLVEEPANTAKNATKYSDYALGKFFEDAKKESYYKNTAFLITGDHPIIIRANSLVPVKKFKIPALLIAPGLAPGKIDTLASQIDLLPTALSILGMETQHPMTGKNLLLNDNAVGKQISIYSHSIAFRTRQKVAIFQPHQEAKMFKLDGVELIETDQDEELSKDALAHILFPVVALKQQIYRHK